MDDLNALVTPSLGAIAVALGITCLVLLVLVVVLLRRTSRLDRRLHGLTRGADDQSLETILGAALDKVHAVARDVDGLTSRAASMEATQRHAFQRIGLVRFNPFEDTGGNQSFALAVLDADGDGFVVSSLHARTGTRVYGKAISGGVSESTLSAEEGEAMRIAMAKRAGPARAG